jgi:hypothetical protein
MAAANAWRRRWGAFLTAPGRVRTAPRDALIADVTPAAHRGRAFGFHRAADTAGAVIGPLIGLGLLSLLDDDFRAVFLIADPGDRRRGGALAGEGAQAACPEGRRGGGAVAELGRPFYVFLGISLLFALGNSTMPS